MSENLTGVALLDDYIKVTEEYDNHKFREHVKSVYKRYWDAKLVNYPRYRDYKYFRLEGDTIYFYIDSTSLNIPIKFFTDTDKVFKEVDDLNTIKEITKRRLDEVGK
jgi:hypothetical protein